MYTYQRSLVCVFWASVPRVYITRWEKSNMIQNPITSSQEGIKLFSGLGWKSENDNHLLENLSGKYWALPQKHDQNRCVFSPKMLTFWSDIKKILVYRYVPQHAAYRPRPRDNTSVHQEAKSVRILSASRPITLDYNTSHIRLCFASPEGQQHIRSCAERELYVSLDPPFRVHILEAK